MAVFMLMSVLFSSLQAEEAELPVAVLISREIKPFIEMVEGFEQALERPVVRIFLDKKSIPFSHDPLYKGTEIQNYDAVIAVGPSALAFLIRNRNQEKIPNQNQEKILYTMVLDPDSIIPKNVSLCGISLNLFSKVPISKISQVFPFIKKTGVLFDPDNNSEWFRNAKMLGLFKGTTIVPVHIQKQSDVNRLYKDDLPGKNLQGKNDFSDLDALLFIPDKTVTSPTIINHIIKQSIIRKIPVIGYNRFFNKSGAALSFVLDYRSIGGQMAQKVKGLLRGEACKPTTPSYHMELNMEVVKLLGLEIGTKLPLELKRKN